MHYSCYSCDCDIEEEEAIYSECDGEWYCEDCYNDTFGHCAYCSCECYNSDLVYLENEDEYVCQSCYDDYMEEHEEDDEENIVRGYHNRDLPIEFKYLDSELKDGLTKEDLLYFGFEVEMYNTKKLISTNDLAKMIRNKYPELGFVFEHDSSLGSSSWDADENGIEMISQPMTKAYIGSIEDKLRDILKMASDNGFTSHNNRYCGLHIHFSRNYFADNEDKYIQKLTLFFEQYKDELKNFSRRTDFNWCQFIGDTCGYDKRFLKSSVILKDYAKDNPSHGIAINLGNSSTIEIRIFKGTLKFETLMSSIELVDSLVRTIKTKETRKISFDNVVNMTGNKYIKEYCENRNIYNSQYLNDETKNVMKELAIKKQRIDDARELTKNELEKTLKDLTELTKETSQEIDFEQDDLRITFSILGNINSILSNRIRDLKSDIFNKDNRNIEDCYKAYLSRYCSNPVNIYSNLIDDLSYIIINSNNDSDLMKKLIDLYNTAKENVNKLTNMLNNTNVGGEE